jgi:hypothetical protein
MEEQQANAQLFGLMVDSHRFIPVFEFESEQTHAGLDVMGMKWAIDGQARTGMIAWAPSANEDTPQLGACMPPSFASPPIRLQLAWILPVVPHCHRA